MLKHRPRPTLMAVLLGLAAVDASALGFGRAPQAAVLGQSLDFAVPLQTAAGESVAPECVAAEVQVGDSRVPPYQVQAALEPAADGLAVRVTTTPVIEEPVVAVTVSVGCTARVTRRFVLLADPPLAAFAAAPAAAAATLVAEAAASTPLPQPSGTAADAAASAPWGPAAAPASAPAAARRVLPPPTQTSPAPPRRTAEAAPRRAPRPAAAPRPPRPAADPRPAEPVARLQLDRAELIPVVATVPSAAVIEDALAAVAEAASAARASALAASASAARIGALEQDVQVLRAQAKASQDEAARWRNEAQASGAGQRWLTPLLLAMLALALLSGWLAWQLRRTRQAAQRSWLRAAAAPPAPHAATTAPATRPIPIVNSELELPPSPARQAWPAPLPVPALQPDELPALGKPAVAAKAPAPPAADAGIEPPLAAGERTEVLAPHLRFDGGAARDVSIEELLDLEQQAEFFIALGQDEAAVDLLVEHLRSTGGGSPLPYLKLLEIYRRRDDPQAYERTRARFNDRFNAYAPDWDSDLLAGRSLEEYEGIVPRLQAAWPRPLDAMAELEALLFRKSRGELFDLPAYREVLFLYALARDLLEREPAEAAAVDILLPLGDADPAPVLPPPLSALDASAHRPTEPVDLDLSMPTGIDSVFDALPDPRAAP